VEYAIDPLGPGSALPFTIPVLGTAQAVVNGTFEA
jgi:hypothetical protein